MLGVDFVINALLETSGFRLAGDCATAIVKAIKMKATERKAEDFTALILLHRGECES